jgi:stearoyl-CoA desaturase (delta-9 desaturase)
VTSDAVPAVRRDVPEADAPSRWSAVTRNLPFATVHALALAAIWTGVSWPAVVVCLGFYWMRVLFITGFYHRYFSHRSFRTSRVFQAVIAFLGTTAIQKGPLWWAGHHRFHHRHSDEEEDVHSPLHGGFWWAHVGWLIRVSRDDTRWEEVKDLARYPELRFLESHYRLGILSFVGGVIGLGFWLEHSFPSTGVTWVQVLVWGFVISTVMLWHTTYLINSGAHMWGSRRFDTKDTSRNNLWLALVTMGEGWHNNHHRYPGSERNGFYWYEIDMTHWFLTMLSWLGLIWDLRRPPRHIYESASR